MERYQIGRVLARGGMCEIREGHVRGGGGFERPVVFKRLREVYADDRAAVDAFYEEARILGALSHRNIIQILDFGDLEGRPFQVLERVDGADLDTLVGRARHRGATVPVEVALQITLEVARALAYAHEAVDTSGQRLGLVHRDVTPRNVLVSWAGDVKLIDFGVAFAEGRLDRTLVGRTKGTLDFMAPEQGRGERVGPRADVFALGCVLHWCLTGASPVEAPRARMQAYVGEAPPIDPALPADVAELVKDAVAPRRLARLDGAERLAERCRAALAARTERDGQAILRSWVGRLRGAPADAAPARHAVGDLFDVELLEASEDTGEDEAPVRRFATVAPGADLGRTVPVRIDLDDDPQTKLTTDRAAAPVPAEAATTILPAGLELEPTHPPAAPAPPAVGATIYGYRLVALLVDRPNLMRFRAVHEVRPASYVVEVHPPGQLSTAALEAWRPRLRVAAAAQHPNLAPVLECGRTPSGHAFVVLEAEHRRTLADLVEAEAPLAPARAARLALEIASGLAAAHARGLVHGGLTPDRVLLEGKGPRAVVHGFGLEPARREGLDPDATVDSAAFDEGWIAPEIMAGEAAAPPTDLYGLGAVLHLMLAGAPPEGADALEALGPHDGLEAVVRRLLSRSPADRPESAAAVMARLRRWAEAREPVETVDVPPARAAELTVEPRPPTAPPSPPAPDPPAPTRWSGPLLGVIGFAVVLALAGLAQRWRSPEQAPVEDRREPRTEQPGRGSAEAPRTGGVD